MLRAHNPLRQPWIIFFLQALKQLKQRLEVKLEREKLLSGQLPQLPLKVLALVKSRGRITISDIVALTTANRNTIKKHLEALVYDKHLNKHGAGNGTWYSIW